MKLHALTTVDNVILHNYTHYLCILTVWISRQQNCANRTTSFQKNYILANCTLVHMNAPWKRKNTRLLMPFCNQR